jgi:hypothetical protein
VQLQLLLLQEFLERLLHAFPDDGQELEMRHRPLEVGFVEGNYDEQFLHVHLDDGLPNQGGAEERPKRDARVAAGYPGEVKERVGDLRRDKTDVKPIF